MSPTTPEDARRELTMILLYLSSFKKQGRMMDTKGTYAWKGYDFGVLNQLEDEDLIRQGQHPSRSSTVLVTEAGMELAQELLQKYGIVNRNGEKA